MSSRCYVYSAVIVMYLLFVQTAQANNSLTAGLSLSYDHDDRQYDIVREDDDYRQLALTPLLHYVFSSSETDTFEIKAAPSIKYDLVDSGTDLDTNLSVAANKAVTKNWKVNISDLYIRSDYSGTENDADAVTSAPALSPDVGRQRYWTNTALMGSDFQYGEGRVVRAGLNYTILRNDDSEDDNYDDYDRYSFDLSDQHRFNRIWSSVLGVSFTRGDFEEKNRAVLDAAVDTFIAGSDLPVSNDFSNDVKEYRFWTSIIKQSSQQDTISLDYDYTGAKYDEVLRNNDDIHQARLNWNRQYSPQLSTSFAAGPSYTKVEGSDGSWGGNGLAQVTYQKEKSSFFFALEKGYELQNFSGTEEKGIVDFWETRFSFEYQLLESLTFDSLLSYRWERREELTIQEASIIESDNNSPLFSTEDFDKNRYTAGFGLNYTFKQYYSANIQYTYSKLDADREEDNYTDNRILLALSWQQEWLRW